MIDGPLTLAPGRSLYNATAGTIAAPGSPTIYATQGGPATIVNAGMITGGGVIHLAGGGSITNQSSGTISGDTGIYAQNAAVTVVNAGSIAASSVDGVYLDAAGAASATKTAA